MKEQSVFCEVRAEYLCMMQIYLDVQKGRNSSNYRKLIEKTCTLKTSFTGWLLV